MRAAHALCEEPELTPAGAAAARPSGGRERDDPLALHEDIAYDWLAQGGKRSRPFITLAAYDALKGGTGTLSADGLRPARRGQARRPGHRGVPQGVAGPRRHRGRRHLPLRPGDAAPQYGVGTAINVGDYLIGLGYRLVSRERKELGRRRAPPTSSTSWPRRT